MAKILNGKEVSARIKGELKAEVEVLKEKGVNPGLAVIIVGDDPASRVYVNSKKKACEEIGILSREYALPAQTTEEELVALVKELNQDDEIDGILCQLPVPKHINDETITDEASAVEKLGEKVHLIPSRFPNIKITVPEDLHIAALLLGMQA